MRLPCCLGGSAATTVHVGPWFAVWHGGRLADIFHAEHEHGATPLDCVEVGPWDFAWTREQLDAARAGLDAGDVRAALTEWARDVGADYAREYELAELAALAEDNGVAYLCNGPHETGRHRPGGSPN